MSMVLQNVFLLSGCAVLIVVAQPSSQKNNITDKQVLFVCQHKTTHQLLDNAKASTLLSP